MFCKQTMVYLFQYFIKATVMNNKSSNCKAYFFSHNSVSTPKVDFG